MYDVFWYIYDKLDAKNQVLGVFVDLKEAFDSVDNNILLNKLDYWSIRGNELNLFRSYLIIDIKE